MQIRLSLSLIGSSFHLERGYESVFNRIILDRNDTIKSSVATKKMGLLIFQ